MKASVIIPTKNPGAVFRRVLDRVLEQEAPWPYEVVVIDSGSTDGTVEFTQSRSPVRLLTIPPQDFGHGRTRNFAISQSTGEFAVLLTHDALPAGTDWLRNLVSAVEQQPDVAGAFGRHIAYPEASPYTIRDIQAHFDGFGAHPEIVGKLTDLERYARDQGWRQFLHYYSDNNSCLRRSVWEQFPYPDVEFAEDQIWARNVVDAGWLKAYAPGAPVYHSHDYGVFERLQRAYDESAAFRTLFGYRLGGSIRQMARSITALSRADWHWGRANDLPLKEIVHRLGEDVALVLGHGLGARSESLPKWLRTRLSRDKRLLLSLGRAKPPPPSGQRKRKPVLRRLFSGRQPAPPGLQQPGGSTPKKIDVEDFWGFVLAHPFGSEIDPGSPPARGTVNWFVPPFGRGSGGHLNIFRFVHHVEKLGFDCRIIVCEDLTGTSSPDLADQIRQWFFPLKAAVVRHPQEPIPPASISVATGWQTAYVVKAFRSTVHRCYFVQDFEPYFHPPGSEYAMAEQTYRFGFTGITAGGWLAAKLHDEYGMETHAFRFSYDRDLYKPHPRRDSIQRVFFYARPPTPRRAFDLGILILSELARRMPDVEMVLAGWDVSGYDLPFRSLNCGVLSLNELPDLYSHCDAALVLSFTNASLLPPELMACGCVVVTNTGPNNEWLLDGDSAMLAPPTIPDMAAALERVLRDGALRARLVQNAFASVQATSWEREAERVGSIFHRLEGSQ